MDNELRASIILNFLNKEFPWLEDGDEDVSGADVVQQLSDAYERLKKKIK